MRSTSPQRSGGTSGEQGSPTPSNLVFSRRACGPPRTSCCSRRTGPLWCASCRGHGRACSQVHQTWANLGAKGPRRIPWIVQSAVNNPVMTPRLTPTRGASDSSFDELGWVDGRPRFTVVALIPSHAPAGRHTCLNGHPNGVFDRDVPAATPAHPGLGLDRHGRTIPPLSAP
jgi:hypothetical protein